MDSMPRPRPLFVRREVTRHGKTVWYFKRDPGKRIRLPDAYGSTEFWNAYQAAVAGNSSGRPAEAKKGSLAWLVERYKESASWASLRPSTQRMRGNILKAACKTAGHADFGKITRATIDDAVMRRSDTPNAANNFRKAMSQLFAWAKRNGHVEVNPCDGAERIKVKTDGHHTWTVEEVDRYRARHPLGTMARLAIDLLLFTGLRRGDVILVGKQHVKNGVLSLRTTKTTTMVHLPILADLRASIDATKTSDLAFLATGAGRPFRSAASFGNWFRERCNEAGLKHCTAHGLRKAGATIAAENGASGHELMAMFGWTKLSMAEVYTKEADRARLARGAAERIANAQPPHLTIGSPHLKNLVGKSDA